MANSARDLRDAIKAMFDLVGAPAAPNRVSIKRLEAEDGELQRLLREIGETRDVQPKLVDEIYTLNKPLAALGARINDANSTVDTILATGAVNDCDILRWRRSALSLCRSNLEALYLDAMLFGKVFISKR